jgi:RHS repeat-associated protein
MLPDGPPQEHVMPISGPILVFLANGTQGGAAVRAAAERGHAMRALVRRAPPGGVAFDVAVGDLDDPVSLLAAARGCAHAVLQVPTGAEHVMVRRAGHAIAALREAGVRSLVLRLASASRPAPCSDAGLVANAAVEALVRGSGIPCAVVRPTMYLDNLLKPSAREDIAGRGIFAVPIAAAQRVAWTSADDCARAAILLLEQGRHGGDHVIAGPEPVTGDALAVHLTAALSRPITFRSEPLAAFEHAVDAAMGAGMGQRIGAKFRYFHDHPADADAAGRMTAIRERGTTLLASYEYDELGRRTRRVLGNGTSTTYGQGAYGLSGLTLAGGDRPLTVGLVYNPAGQIKARTSSDDGFSYTGHYNVDRGYTPNVLNQYTASGPQAIAHDAAGNLTASGTTGYGYDGRGHMVSAPGVRLGYGATGLLDTVAPTTPGAVPTRWEWDGADLVTERQGGAIVRRYVHGAGVDEVVAWYEGSGTAPSARRWLDADERGSVVRVTDDTGHALGVNTYDEYGVPGGSRLGRFQYTGQMWLPEAGLYYYKARMYSPTLGRFMQPDPAGFGDGLNLYDYVGGGSGECDRPERVDPISGRASLPERGTGTLFVERRSVSLRSARHAASTWDIVPERGDTGGV